MNTAEETHWTAGNFKFHTAGPMYFHIFFLLTPTPFCFLFIYYLVWQLAGWVLYNICFFFLLAIVAKSLAIRSLDKL